MLQKWWIDQVNEMLEGTGERLVPIRSFNEALIWEVLEVLVLIQVIVSGLFLLDNVIGSFAHLGGIIVTLVIMFKFVRTLKHPDINCWKSPEEPKVLPWHSE